MAKPAKGKAKAKKVKNPKTGRTRTVSYGQAGKAKGGRRRVKPGTAKGRPQSTIQALREWTRQHTNAVLDVVLKSIVRRLTPASPRCR